MTETDTLGQPVVKVAIADILAMAQKARQRQPEQRDSEPGWIGFLRGACWFTFAAAGSLAIGASCLRWSDTYRTESVTLSWLWVLMVLAFFGALAVTITPKLTRILALLSELVTGQGEIVAQVQALRLAVGRQPSGTQSDEDTWADDDAFVDALSEREDGPRVNGHKVTRMVRPRSYDRDWPKRT